MGEFDLKACARELSEMARRAGLLEGILWGLLAALDSEDAEWVSHARKAARRAALGEKPKSD
jgi:hypothetical protein